MSDVDMTSKEIDIYYWLKETSMEEVARYIARLEED